LRALILETEQRACGRENLWWETIVQLPASSF
jgi:hypothetical protein